MTDQPQTSPTSAGEPIRPTFAPWWTNEGAWMPDTPEHVFWARALVRIGRAMFGGGWEGPEFGLLPPPVVELPGWPFPTPNEKVRHATLLGALISKHDPERWAQLCTETAAAHQKRWALQDEVRSRPAVVEGPQISQSASYSGGGLGGRRAQPARRYPPPPPPEGPAVVQRATEIVAEIARLGEAHRARAQAVEAAVADACAQRRLRTYWQNTVTGVPVPFGEGWWIVSPAYRASRFTACQIDIGNPVAPTGGTKCPLWIYALKEDLDALEASLAAQRKANAKEPGDAGEPAGYQAARRDLVERCGAHYDRGDGPVPVGAVWREEARERFGIGVRGAKRAWDSVAEKYPALSERGGKPKRKRAG